MAEGNFAAAAGVYQEMVEAAPDNPGLLLNLGMAHHLAGESAKAIPRFEEALKIQPGIVPAMLFLGDSYLDVGQPAKAITPLQELVSVQPELKDARELLGDALTGTGQTAQAAAHYRKWSGLDRTNPRAWFSLVTAYESLSHETYEALQENHPESAYLLALLGEVRASQKQFRSAFYLYRKALERQPEMGGLHAGIALIYRETGHADWAAKEEEAEREIPAPDCKVHPLECGYHAGKFLSVASASGNTPEALYWRALAYNGLAKEARERLAALPPSLESHELLAELHTTQDRHVEAAKEWRAALELAPGDAGRQTDLAISLYRSRDYEGALTVLEPLLEKQPDSAEINYYIGDCLLIMQQPEKAVPYLAKSVEKQSGFLPGQSSLGRAYLQLRQGAEAVPHLKAALQIDEDGSLHFQLSRAYQMSGETAAAKEMIVKYQEIRKANEAERRELEVEAQIVAP